MRKTYTTLLIFLFVTCGTCQESGSIFDEIETVDIVEADSSEVEEVIEDDSGEPLPNDSEEILTGSDEVTEIVEQDADAEDDTVPLGDTVAEEEALVIVEVEVEYDLENPVDTLVEENEILASENLELELELANTLNLVNQFRLQEAQKLKAYANEMEILAGFNGIITYVPDPVERVIDDENLESETDDSDEEDNEYMETSLAMIAVIGLGFLFLLLHSLKGIWISFSSTELSQGVYTILIDSTILVLLWCITAVLDYLDALSIDISTILVGLALFTFFWLSMGLWLLFIAHLQGLSWKKQEKLAQVPGDKSKEQLKYMLMRQLFISPIYTSNVTETQLKPDFNMASYLCRGLGDIIHTNFHITWVGYSLIVASIIIWRMFIANHDFYEVIVFWSLPGLIFLSILVVIFKLRRVFAALVPEEFKKELKISPLKSLGSTEVRECIARPKYLRGNIDEDLSRSCICCKVNPFKMTCAYLFLSRYPNRHELLFWFDSYGPTFIGIIVQALAVLLTLWITGIILYYIPIFMEEIIDEVSEGAVYLIVLALLVWLITAFYLLPKIFIYLCITTKIEMMKQRDFIEDTIGESRKNAILKTIKIYRQLKMIYREVKGREEGEEKGQILQFMRQLAEEVFLLVSTDRKTIHVTEIDEVLNLIGVQLQEDELRLFAKECAPDKNNFLSLDSFKIAIERVLYGFEIKPHEVVKHVLNEHFKKKKINIGDLSDFFNEWSWHFNEEDLREFLVEAQSLADELGYFKHEEVANMIRINVEACPK